MHYFRLLIGRVESPDNSRSWLKPIGNPLCGPKFSLHRPGHSGSPYHWGREHSNQKKRNARRPAGKAGKIGKTEKLPFHKYLRWGSGSWGYTSGKPNFEKNHFRAFARNFVSTFTLPQQLKGIKQSRVFSWNRAGCCLAGFEPCKDY